MTAPLRFVRRPLPLEAIRNTSDEAAVEIVLWARREHDVLIPWEYDAAGENTGALLIPNGDGWLRCAIGDWLVRDHQGRFCPWTDAAIKDLTEPAPARFVLERCVRGAAAADYTIVSDLDNDAAWVNPVEVH